MNSIYNRTDEEFSVIGEVQANFIANDPLYQQGFKAGADSRATRFERRGGMVLRVAVLLTGMRGITIGQSA